jgi:BASS family bile acid:Na+ symporter
MLHQFTRLMPVWVVLCGAIAFFFPAPFVALKPGMNWFFALTMFGIGVVLEARDFAGIARRWPIVLIGVVAQFTIMPLGAWALCRALALPDALAVGLILTGSAPGAMASNVMCYVAKADTAYSVSLTTASTLLCPVLTPGLTLMLAGARIDVGFWSLFFQVLFTVVVPLLAGFAVRWLFNRRLQPILPLFPAISALFIVFICSLVIALNRDRLAHVTALVLAVAVMLNLYGMSGGYGIGKLFRMQLARRRTLAIEIGMQNAGLGVVLALANFGEETALPAAIFVFVCILSASLLAGWWQRRDAAAAA